MTFAIEKSLAKWIPAATGVSAFVEVPNPRPAEFVAFERVGGSPSIGIDRPSITFDVWAASRMRAEELALILRDALLYQLAADVPQVRGVRVGSVYNFPDLDSGNPRYQLTADLTTE